MDTLKIHSSIIRDYSTYIGSFLNIADPLIRVVVEAELEKGKLWPEPLLQFNPAFKKEETVETFAAAGHIHPACARIFKGYTLYHHQVEALKWGTKGSDFVLTSGTGSGKSLTYIGTIFHHLLSESEAKGGTAVIVYPMNALINSQSKEFQRYESNYRQGGDEFPITVAQYTGQENEDTREKLRKSPPQVLLTNYMMLELILTRVRERPIRDAIFENLRYLVFDELHMYRGRQGADIAMLIRRIRSRCRHEVACIGTSATMSSLDKESSQEEVARTASALFGKNLSSQQVIVETLDRSLTAAGEVPDKARLASAIEQSINFGDSIDELRSNAVAKWLEEKVALESSDKILRRRQPQRLSDVVSQLSRDSGVEESRVRIYLSRLLEWISIINENSQLGGKPYTILPFKLHQFISQTGSVYTTLDQDENRFITLEPGLYKPDEDQKKPIFPNVFSRASGHAYICVSRIGDRLEPREFRERTDDEENTTFDGYLIVGEDVWDPEEDIEYLPESWFKRTKKGFSIDSKRRGFFPIKLYFDEYGNCSEKEPLKWWGWFMQAPLLFDPTGGVFFETKTSEGTKLAKLGSEGRSTSTTITAFSILHHLDQAGFKPIDQKLLSFTDNRQDAALQAGHFNDFVQVIRLRAGIFEALRNAPLNRLSYTSIGEAVFRSLDLPFLEFANREQDAPLPHIRRSYEQCLQTFLMYRILADLRRSWRIILPNLEQCGLLNIEYSDIDETADSNDFWKDLQILEALSFEERREFISTILDFFRLEYAIHSENFLTQSKLKEHEKQFRELLRAPWSLDRNEEIREPNVLRLDPLSRASKMFSKSVGPASAVGKFIKLYCRQRGISVDLKGDNYRLFITGLLDRLHDADYLKRLTARNEENEEVSVYRLKIEKIVWRLGDGEHVKADLIKRRAYKDHVPKPNRFFQQVYQRKFSVSKRLVGQDHTGQLSNDLRIDWETKFNKGEISALFCSPTMELGIDIGGLSVVHMRNAPPSPANYAQRSGRAGRNGQGALIFTYCSSYSPHDRHCFQNQVDLVAGDVRAQRLDLCNQELLLSHLNSMAISEVGVPGLDDQTGVRPSIMRLVTDDNDTMPLASETLLGLDLIPAKREQIAKYFGKAVSDFAIDLQARAPWYTQEWIDQNLGKLADHLDTSLIRWRRLYKSARTILTRATQKLDSATLPAGSDEYRKHKRNLDQATRQLDLLKNEASRTSSELSEFYPYRYLASEGFLPGYNFTRLPLRVFLPTSDSSGEFISRPRSIALREFGPLNVVYYNGRKYKVSQLITQEIETSVTEAKISKKAGYFLAENQKGLEICPFTDLNLSDNANVEHVHHLLEMSESRAEETDRISCEEEERLSRGFDIKTYFSVDGGHLERVRKAVARSSESSFLNLRFIPAARLVHVNYKWRSQLADGFPIGLISGDWRASMPEQPEVFKESFRLIKLMTSNLADALYIEPIAPLGLSPEGVITLQYALKRGTEAVFQVEPNEIGAMSLGDPKTPNILLFEAAEGSLGILSQFVDDINAFHRVIEKADAICRFDDEKYKGPASYNDLLSYYNQRDHKVIDRHLIKDALQKLRICDIEIQTNPTYANYDKQYQSLISAIDPNSSTERKFLDYLYSNGLRLPDSAQARVEGIYVQPDFYYEPRIWIFCDGTPHDDPLIRTADDQKRQAIIASGAEVWTYYYRDNLAEKIARRPDIFRKVR